MVEVIPPGGIGIIRGGRGGQFLQTLDDALDLVGAPFRDLQNGLGLGRILLGHLQGSHFDPQLIGDGQAGHVVFGVVDPVAGCEPFHGKAQTFVGIHQGAMGLESGDVGVNAQRH